MSRHTGMRPWGRSIPFAVVLAILGACAKPPQEVEDRAAVIEEPVASPKPTSETPPAPAPTPSAPPPDFAPPPVETPEQPPTPAPASITAAAPPSGSAAEPAPDPLKVMMEQEARRQEYEKLLAKLAADRDAAQDNVARVERDLLATKNPFLARPVLNQEETAAVQGKSGAERAAWAEARLAEAKESVKAAQKAYDDAKANPPGN